MCYSRPFWTSPLATRFCHTAAPANTRGSSHPSSARHFQRTCTTCWIGTCPRTAGVTGQALGEWRKTGRKPCLNSKLGVRPPLMRMQQMQRNSEVSLVAEYYMASSLAAAALHDAKASSQLSDEVHAPNYISYHCACCCGSKHCGHHTIIITTCRSE